MGRKKGKMTNPYLDQGGVVAKKWMKNDYIRNLDLYVDQARKEAYNQKILKIKKQEQSRRPKLHFPYLNYLISERLRADSYRFQPASNHQIFDVDSSKEESLTRLRNESYAKSYFEELHYQSLLCPLSLQSLTIQKVAKFIDYYDTEHILLVLEHMTENNISLLSYYCALFNSVSPEKFLLFSRFPLDVIYIPRSVSNKALLDYINALQDNSSYSFQHEENWETIDLSSFELINRSNRLTTIYFNRNKFTLRRLNQILDALPALQNFAFINNEFLLLDDHNREGFDRDVLNVKSITTSKRMHSLDVCQQFLQLLFNYPRRTILLDLIFCEWVNYDQFQQHLNSFSSCCRPRFSFFRINIKILVELKRFSLAEIDEMKQKWDLLCDEYRNAFNMIIHVNIISDC